jgi:hypothetical protein
MYCDNTFPRNSYNTELTDAYVREDGSVQPSALVWELREYHKLMWKMEQDCQPISDYPLLISLHMTNGNILPIVTWGDINLDNEWAWQTGEGPFPVDVLQTEMIGLQAGSYPHALYAIIGDKVLPRATAKGSEHDFRAEWGMRFTHEILRCATGAWAFDNLPMEKVVRDFGYGQDDCQIIHYWDTDRLPGQPAITVNNQNIKWIGLWKPAEKRLMVVMVNWQKDGQNTNLTVTPPKGVKLSSWQDAEKKTPVPAGELAFGPWDVKILEVSGK